MPQEHPVDLVALRAAVAPVRDCYEAFLAGHPLDLPRLDRALAGLRALPPVGGRLGRALAVVAVGGHDATTEETVAALDLLRASAGLRCPPPRPVAPASQPRRRRRNRTCSQAALPGIEGA